MADSIALWSVADGRLVRLDRRQIDRERRLEDWIESNPDVLGEKLLIVGRQVRTKYGGIIDLLAVDADGRCVVIELKRGLTPRDIVAQAMDYVSWVAELTDSDVRELAARTSNMPFADSYRLRYGGVAPEQLNADQRMLIVATDIDDATTRIVEHMTKRYGVDINVVALSYFMAGEQELLARTWIVDPSELEERVDARILVDDEITVPVADDLWHVNVGISPSELVERNWDDPRRFGFLSAGHGVKWREELRRLSVGDHVYAYLNGAGYVGDGFITTTAERADMFVPPGQQTALRDLPGVSPAWFHNSEDPDLAEYMVGVRWNKTLATLEGVRVLHPLRGTVRRIKSAELAATLLARFG